MTTGCLNGHAGRANKKSLSKKTIFEVKKGGEFPAFFVTGD